MSYERERRYGGNGRAFAAGLFGGLVGAPLVYGYPYGYGYGYPSYRPYYYAPPPYYYAGGAAAGGGHLPLPNGTSRSGGGRPNAARRVAGNPFISSPVPQHGSVPGVRPPRRGGVVPCWFNAQCGKGYICTSSLGQLQKGVCVKGCSDALDSLCPPGWTCHNGQCYPTSIDAIRQGSYG
jgi:hypothetical protein